MRCIACDAELSDSDARARDGVGEYNELCGRCRIVVREIVKTGNLPEGQTGGELWQPQTYGLDHTGKGEYVHPNKDAPAFAYRKFVHG